MSLTLWDWLSSLDAGGSQSVQRIINLYLSLLITLLFVFISTGICIDPIVYNMTRVTNWVVYCACTLVPSGGHWPLQRQPTANSTTDPMDLYIHCIIYIPILLV